MLYMCVKKSERKRECAHVCMIHRRLGARERARGKERDRERQRETERDRERQSLCMRD